MSDSDEAFSDELLELAGATDKKRKRRQNGANGSKRRKAEAAAESASEGDGPESEEEDVEMNPYPLEGKFIDEYDREQLLSMPEIEREEVLAQRQEELQRIQDKRNLDQMFKATKEGAGEDDSVSKAAKRAHAVRGATKEKSRKLDELKARRRAKDVTKKSRSSPEKRDRSSSPMEMETSDEDDEDGQITREEQEEERERRILEKYNPQEENITVEDLDRIRLSRDALAKYCLAPWFEDYAKGAWVRYLVGQDKGEPVYRICEISNLAPDLEKPYPINNQLTDQFVELKHGSAVKAFPMDKVSNASFTMREWERLVKTCEGENVKLPSKRQIEKKATQIQKLMSQPMTESDVSAMLQRKNQIQERANPAAKTSAARLLEKSRLTTMRNLAAKRNDREEVATLDRQLADLQAEIALDPSSARREADSTDIMAKVNERNRKANLEAMKLAAQAEAERKRKERQAAKAGAAPADPSARLRTVPRMFASRSGTPNINGAKTPQPATPGSASPLPPGTGSPTPKPVAKDDFTSQVLQNIEVDLGDF